MQDVIHKFLLTIFNIPSNRIYNLSYLGNEENLYVEVTLKHTDKQCPFCHSSHNRSNGYFKKQVSHTTSFFKNITIIFRIQRLKCVSCLKTFSQTDLLNPAKSKLSYQQILHIMHLLKEASQTFRSVSRLTGIPETTILRIFDRYCPNFDYTLPTILSFDEVYIKQSDVNSKFACILYDFQLKNIVDVLAYRKKDFLANYFSSKDENELNNVSFVCIDMYKPYKEICKRYLKNATICVDSFHVIKLLNDCFSSFRIFLMKQYDSHSIEYYLLKKWYFLLSNRKKSIHNTPKYNHKLKQSVNYAQILNMLLSINPLLTQAYRLKEDYITFNETPSSPIHSFKDIEEFILSFSKLNISQFNPFITALKNWHVEIANSFTYFNGRRINNSYAEGINSIVKNIILNTRGIKNSTRRKKRIIYVVNKIDYLKN